MSRQNDRFGSLGLSDTEMTDLIGHLENEMDEAEEKLASSETGTPEHHHHHHHHHHASSSESGSASAGTDSISGAGGATAGSRKKKSARRSKTSSRVDTSYRKKKRRKKKKAGPLGILVRILLILLVLLGCLVGVILVMREIGRRNLLNRRASEVTEVVPEDVEAEVQPDGSILYDGEYYLYNKGLTNILIMGVDRRGDMTDTEAVLGESSGQADALAILSLDTNTGVSNLVNISRDAMVDVDEFDIDGDYSGTVYEQICLSYSTGDGGKLSATNTCNSVSRLMYGIPVNAYCAIDLDAIGPLTDVIGGLDVVCLDDLSSKEEGWTEGTSIHLTGENAETYVRFRDKDNPDPEIATQSNNARMARQRQYITAFLAKAVGRIRQDPGFALTVFNSLTDYMVTDIDASEVTYLSSLFVTHDLTQGNMHNLPGHSEMGERYIEYKVDNRELYPLILQLFYDKL